MFFFPWTLFGNKNQHFRNIFWDFAEFHMILYNWPRSEITANITNTSFRVEGTQNKCSLKFRYKKFCYGKKVDFEIFCRDFFLMNCFWKCWRKKNLGQMFNLFQYFQIFIFFQDLQIFKNVEFFFLLGNVEENNDPRFVFPGDFYYSLVLFFFFFWENVETTFSRFFEIFKIFRFIAFIANTLAFYYNIQI